MSETEMPDLIAITGRKGHGKDTAAAAFEDYELVRFADALKKMVYAYLEYVGVSKETAMRYVDGDMKETPLAIWGGKTTRYVMQTLGTEWGRFIIWDELWINAWRMRTAMFKKIVTPDMRFYNEGNVVEKKGGMTLRVVDPRKPFVRGEHPSEDLVDDLPVQYSVSNDGTIADLHREVRLLAQEYRRLSARADYNLES